MYPEIIAQFALYPSQEEKPELLAEAYTALKVWLSELMWEKRYELNSLRFENEAIRIDLKQSVRSLTAREGLYWCVDFLRIRVDEKYRGNGTTQDFLELILSESPSDFYYCSSPVNKTLIKVLENMGCEKQKSEGIYPDYCYPLRKDLRPDGACRVCVAAKLKDSSDVKAFSEGNNKAYFYKRRDHLQMLADMCAA